MSASQNTKTATPYTTIMTADDPLQRGRKATKALVTKGADKRARRSVSFSPDSYDSNPTNSDKSKRTNGSRRSHSRRSARSEPGSINTGPSDTSGWMTVRNNRNKKNSGPPHLSRAARAMNQVVGGGVIHSNHPVFNCQGKPVIAKPTCGHGYCDLPHIVDSFLLEHKSIAISGCGTSNQCLSSSVARALTDSTKACHEVTEQILNKLNFVGKRLHVLFTNKENGASNLKNFHNYFPGMPEMSTEDVDNLKSMGERGRDKDVIALAATVFLLYNSKISVEVYETNGTAKPVLRADLSTKACGRGAGATTDMNASERTIYLLLNKGHFWTVMEKDTVAARVGGYISQNQEALPRQARPISIKALDSLITEAVAPRKPYAPPPEVLAAAETPEAATTITRVPPAATAPNSSYAPPAPEDERATSSDTIGSSVEETTTTNPTVLGAIDTEATQPASQLETHHEVPPVRRSGRAHTATKADDDESHSDDSGRGGGRGTGRAGARGAGRGGLRSIGRGARRAL